MMHPPLHTTILACALVASLPGEARSYEARIVHARGTVLQVGTPSVPIQTGSVIAAGSRIRTSQNAILVLETSEGARLKVKGDSEIEIGDGSHPGARLHRGGVFAKIPKLKGARPAYRIRARAAVMGVRGTEFYSGFGSKSSELWMCVREGEVEVITPRTPEKPVLVTAGLGVWIREEGPPPEAKPYEWTKQLNWNQDPDAGELEDRTRPATGYPNPIQYNYD